MEEAKIKDGSKLVTSFNLEHDYQESEGLTKNSPIMCRNNSGRAIRWYAVHLDSSRELQEQLKILEEHEMQNDGGACSEEDEFEEGSSRKKSTRRNTHKAGATFNTEEIHIGGGDLKEGKE